VDFPTVENFLEIHRILKESLNFPDYYGCHLDALFDCLTDMLAWESHIELIGLNKLKKYNAYDKKVIEVFSDAKHDYNDKFSKRFFVTIVHEDGTREEIQ
jgi:ribonuclease inhibitor